MKKMWPFGGSSINFTSKDIPSLQGKVIIVTGGNSGLGKYTVLELARHEPKEIWLTARSIDKADEAIEEIKQKVPGANLKPLVLDLTSFDSIKAAARTFTNVSQRLDIMILNAGCMATPASTTEDGYEMQFGTNHMGHALLVKLLTPVLEKTAAAAEGPSDSDIRVVVVASASVAEAPQGGIQFDTLKTTQEELHTWRRYGQSKLANALYARGLARAHPDWTVTAVHPGVAITNIAHYVVTGTWWWKPLTTIARPFVTPIEGVVLHQIWAATGPKENIKTGELYFPVGDLTGGRRGPYSKDDALAQRLWDWTEEELKEQTT